MNETDQALAEAKSFVLLHAKFLGIDDIEALLARITSLDGTETGSWLGVFTELAADSAAPVRRRADLYGLARFPCADTAPKQAAAAEAARLVATDLVDRGAGSREVARTPHGEVPFLFRSAGPGTPLAIVIGGIVSLKEQWAAYLDLAPRVGCSIALVDFPGVGENPMRYDRAATALFPALIGAVGTVCDSTRTVLIAPSFGGHLALAAATVDHRITRIVTVDAPLRAFFIRADPRAQLPVITAHALARCCGVTSGELAQCLPALALTESEVAEIGCPVDFVVSTRDELAAAPDWRWAQALAPRLSCYPIDDIHGAPHHLRRIRFLVAAALLTQSGHRRGARLARLGSGLRPAPAIQDRPRSGRPSARVRR